MSNLRILRLNNSNGDNPKLSYFNNNTGFKYIINNDLINMGRCLVEVISGWAQITRGAERIVPNNITQLVIRSNIEIVGDDSITGGNGNILGTMSLQDTNGTAGLEVTNSASFNQNDSLKFLCNRLPSQISIEKLYYNDDLVLVEADNLAGNNNVPCEVVLQLTFLDMLD